MRFYQQHVGDVDLHLPVSFYHEGDAGRDALCSLNTDERPSIRNVGPAMPVRLEAARVARFWRRFQRSSLRARLRTLPTAERFEAFKAFMKAFSSRLPNRYELMVGGDLLGKWKSGKNPTGDAFMMAGYVAQYMAKIPQTFLDYFARPQPQLELQESDDDIVDLEPVPARMMELLPRERYLPKPLRREMRARQGLTRWQWLDIKPSQVDPPIPEVQFLVDSSGSMNGKKFALAIAAALRIAETAGRSPTIRFVADDMGPILQPEEALSYAVSPERRRLGGGDNFGTRLAEAELASPQVTDFVVVSDFAIDHDISPTEWGEKPLPAGYNPGAVFWPNAALHAIGIAPCASAWWEKPRSRHDFTDLL